MVKEDIRTRNVTDIQLPPLTKLQTVLFQLGIPILDDDDVEKYKAEKLEQKKAELKGAARRLHFPYVNFLCLLFLIGFAWLSSPSDLLLRWLEVFGALAIIICGTLEALREFGADETLELRFLDWRSYYLFSIWPLDLHDQWFQAPGVREPTRIPAAIVAGCFAIRQQCPDAEFSLHQLDSDPFIFVTTDEEEWDYGIFVFDEEGFHPQAQP